MAIIGPRNALVNRLYTGVPYCKHKSKKRVVYYQQTCYSFHGAVEILSLVPFMLNGQQYGRIVGGTRCFRKQGRHWEQIKAIT